MSDNIHLVVDDDRDNLSILKMRLQILDKGSTVIIIDNPIDAIDKVKELFKEGKRIHSIIMDFQMPEMNGAECLDKIHEFMLEGDGEGLLCSKIKFTIYTSITPDYYRQMCEEGKTNIYPYMSKLNTNIDLMVFLGLELPPR